jgi:hypothetical protein
MLVRRCRSGDDGDGDGGDDVDSSIRGRRSPALSRGDGSRPRRRRTGRQTRSCRPGWQWPMREGHRGDARVARGVSQMKSNRKEEKMSFIAT